MNDIIVCENVEQRWKDILECGKLYNGISENVDPDQPPRWFDRIKFEKAQQLGLKYYGSLVFGQFIGLLLVLYHSDGLAPLVVTGNSSNVQKLFRRYLSTIIHVKSWYEFDPFDKNSKSYQSLKHVRSLHTKVAKSMNEKSKRVEGIDNLWISQYGMTHAQFAFIGFVALYPKQCGLHHLSYEDMDCLIYFWRVIGYCLGTDDRFNLCSGTSEEAIQLCHLIFTKEWLPVINCKPIACPGGEEMAKGICLAMNKVAKINNWNVLMKYWYPILKIEKPIELQTLSEHLWYYLVKYTMNYLTKLSIFQNLLTLTARFDTWIAIKFKNFKYESLKKQYTHLSYDNKSCPFDVNFDYTDAFEVIKDISKNNKI